MYVEYSVKTFDTTNPYIQIDILKDNIRQLEADVKLMESRDLDFELLKNENLNLNKTIVSKAKKISQLRERNLILSKELRESKNNSIKMKSKIVDINTTNKQNTP